MTPAAAAPAAAPAAAAPAAAAPAAAAAGEHPLEHTWVVWEHRGEGDQGARGWGDLMTPLFEFATAEAFWANFAFLPPVSAVLTDSRTLERPDVEFRGERRSVESYSVFKKGIVPAWEDPVNAAGSEVFIKLRLSGDECDALWEGLILALIGATLDDADQVCGARICDKSRKAIEFKLEVWLRPGPNSPVLDEMKRRLTALADQLVPGFSRRFGAGWWHRGHSS